MSAVTVSTNMERPKMVFAGVDAGAKIFAELNGNPVVAALASVVTQNNNASLIAPGLIELC